MADLTTIFHHLQRQLFPALTAELGALSALDQQFCEVISLTELGRFTRRYEWCGNGCPPCPRIWLAHAFIAKHVYQFPTAGALLNALQSRPLLRQLCGWESAGEIPSEPTFSRAFAAFAQDQLPQQIHERMVKTHAGAKLVGHVSRDATAIEAPERPAAKSAPAAPAAPRNRGRPKQGEVRPPTPPKRLELQPARSLAENLAELPTRCDVGCKRNRKGHQESWIGYKCVFRSLSDSDSNVCRTGFRFLPDTIPIPVGQGSGRLSDSFWAGLEGCPTGLEQCPAWPGIVSDSEWNPGVERVERRGNGCQGGGSIQVDRERPYLSQTKLTMRQIQELLRLKHQNQLSIREIARSCGLPSSTVGDYLKRAEAAGVKWPLPEGQSEKELLQLLIAAPVAAKPAESLPLPDWPQLHQELGRKSVTLMLLWQEYRQAQPAGYGYSRFCQLYQRWAGTLDLVLRQVPLPGEKLFVDWAGQTVPIHNAVDGSLSAGHLFVAVLGASNKTYVEAFANEQLAAWLAAHCHAYAFFQGVARVTVPDNLKTGVIRPCRYEPLLHRSYQELAEHYGTGIIPARIKKPRDKAKAEVGVQIAERQILAALRDRRFFTVAELNTAIRPLLAKLNAQPFQKLEGSRDRWFETLERGQLLPLPAMAFELATWSKAKVNIDYHVAVDKHFYSAPHALIHQQLDVRLTDRTVELFQHGKRVAAHVRSSLAGRFTTVAEHRPKSHQRYWEWTPSRILEWVKTIGPDCAQVVAQILADRPHPEQGFRSALGIIRLGKAVGHDRLEAACRRALHFGTCSYVSLKSILQNNLDGQPLEPESPLPSPLHENLRGGPYYN